MSLQDTITNLLLHINDSAKYGHDCVEVLKAADGNLATIADPTLSYDDSPFALVAGTPITPASPTAGGGPIVEYRMKAGEALPPGLILDRVTGIITGTPLAEGDSDDTVYTVIGVGMAVDIEAEITISVSVLLDFSYSDIAVPNTVLIDPEIAPVMVGGKWGTFVATDALPTGMTIDADTGEIGGTPSGGASGPTDYTITATNDAGAVPVEVSIEVTA